MSHDIDRLCEAFFNQMRRPIAHKAEIRDVLMACYYASLMTEEGEKVRFDLCMIETEFADGMQAFETPVAMDAERLRKLSSLSAFSGCSLLARIPDCKIVGLLTTNA